MKNKSSINVNQKDNFSNSIINWGFSKPLIDKKTYTVNDIVIKNRFDFGEEVENVSRPFLKSRK